MTKSRLGGAAMSVDDTAGWRQQALPTTFPRLIRNVRVLNVKRTIERIESADCEIFLAMDSTRTPASPKDWDTVAHFILLTEVIVPQIKRSVFKACACLASLFAPALGIREEDL